MSKPLPPILRIFSEVLLCRLPAVVEKFLEIWGRGLFAPVSTLLLPMSLCIFLFKNGMLRGSINIRVIKRE